MHAEHCLFVSTEVQTVVTGLYSREYNLTDTGLFDAIPIFLGRLDPNCS